MKALTDCIICKKNKGPWGSFVKCQRPDHTMIVRIENIKTDDSSFNRMVDCPDEW